MQHVLVGLQYKKESGYKILISVISLFECPGALVARGRRHICPLLCTPLVAVLEHGLWLVSASLYHPSFDFYDISL